MNKLIFYPAEIANGGDKFRFISGGLVHADFWHLGINMYVLWAFGTDVEAAYIREMGNWGNVLYVLLYVFGVIAGNLPAYLKYNNNPAYRGLGASGATSAVLFAFIIFKPLHPFLFNIPAVIFGVLYVAYEYYASKRRLNDGIGHDAHLWGAIFGFVFTIALKPELFMGFLGKLGM